MFIKELWSLTVYNTSGQFLFQFSIHVKFEILTTVHAQLLR